MRPLQRLFEITVRGLLFAIVLSACSSNPSLRFDHRAAQLGLSKTVYSNSQFELSIYARDKSTASDQNNFSSVLHVYLDGDGTPWITPNHISIDPTPRMDTVLNLMHQDTESSIYLGRPCYHNQARDEHCDPALWTSARYSKPVVDALIFSLTKYVTDRSTIQPVDAITLIGFSGGGTLAMLMAPNIPLVRRIITINGNLDIDHWTRQHGFSPLSHSLNPIHQPKLPEHIEVHHLFGRKDKIIDAHYLANYFSTYPNTKTTIFDEFSHHCCWNQVWREIVTAP